MSGELLQRAGITDAQGYPFPEAGIQFVDCEWIRLVGDILFAVSSVQCFDTFGWKSSQSVKTCFSKMYSEMADFPPVPSPGKRDETTLSDIQLCHHLVNWTKRVLS